MCIRDRTNDSVSYYPQWVSDTEFLYIRIEGWRYRTDYSDYRSNPWKPLSNLYIKNINTGIAKRVTNFANCEIKEFKISPNKRWCAILLADMGDTLVPDVFGEIINKRLYILELGSNRLKLLKEGNISSIQWITNSTIVGCIKNSRIFKLNISNGTYKEKQICHVSKYKNFNIDEICQHNRGILPIQVYQESLYYECPDGTKNFLPLEYSLAVIDTALENFQYVHKGAPDLGPYFLGWFGEKKIGYIPWDIYYEEKDPADTLVPIYIKDLSSGKIIKKFFPLAHTGYRIVWLKEYDKALIQRVNVWDVASLFVWDICKDRVIPCIKAINTIRNFDVLKVSNGYKVLFNIRDCKYNYDYIYERFNVNLILNVYLIEIIDTKVNE